MFTFVAEKVRASCTRGTHLAKVNDPRSYIVRQLKSIPYDGQVILISSLNDPRR